MAMKSYFMDELHSIINNSSTTSDNPINKNVDENLVISLNKIRLLESENKLLKD